MTMVLYFIEFSFLQRACHDRQMVDFYLHRACDSELEAKFPLDLEHLRHFQMSPEMFHRCLKTFGAYFRGQTERFHD